jgi:hypothetical protein
LAFNKQQSRNLKTKSIPFFRWQQLWESMGQFGGQAVYGGHYLNYPHLLI